MKTLNRTLSLALVFALVFSLMSFAFAADTTTTTTTTTTPTTTTTTQANVTYTDAASISYKEAVGVTSAIGVFQGNNGAFDPKTELTREQAAKIITYMILGKTTADSLKASTAPFTDVPADRWSAGSIAYCQSQGIVSGYGDGTFGVNDKVTGFQFSKMLLVALGYDATIEGFTGSSWALNVAKRAYEKDLYKDNASFDGNKAATREEAALYSFNTLKAIPVFYENKGMTITSKDGTSIVTGASAAQNILTGKTYYQVHFPALEQVDSQNTLGEPTSNWSYDKKPVNTYEQTKPVVTYTAKTPLAKVAADLKGYTYAAAVAQYINANNTPLSTCTASTIADLTGNGKLVEVYATSQSQINRVVVVNTVLAKVAAIDSTTAKVTYAVPAADGFCTAAGASASAVGYGSVKVGDYVIATFAASADTLNVTAGAIDNAQIISVAAPTVVTGKATSKTNTTDTKTITLNGKVYTASANIVTDKNVGNFTIDENHDATLLLDANGYIVSAKSGTSKTNETVGMILKAYGKVGTDGTYAPMIDVVRSDGVTVSIPVTSAQTGNEGKTVVLTPSIATVGSYDVAPTTATNGSAINPTTMYVKENLNTVSNSVLKNDIKYSATYSSSKDKDFYYSSDVKFIFYNATTKTATVLTGVQAIAQANVDVTFALYDTDTAVSATQADYVITAAFVIGNAPSTAATTKDILFANGTVTATSKQNNIPLFTNVVYNEGTKLDGGATTPLAQFGEGFYYATQDSTTKLYSAANVFTTDGKISADHSGINLASIKNDAAITVNSTDYKLTSATKYIGVSDGAIATVSDLDTLEAYLKGASANAWILYNNETNEVLYVYVDVVSNSATLTGISYASAAQTITGTALPAITFTAEDKADKVITMTPAAGATVTAVAASDSAKANVTGFTSGGTTFTLKNVAAGTSTVTITVTAADGLTTQNYTIAVTSVAA